MSEAGYHTKTAIEDALRMVMNHRQARRVAIQLAKEYGIGASDDPADAECIDLNIDALTSNDNLAQMQERLKNHELQSTVIPTSIVLAPSANRLDQKQKIRIHAQRFNAAQYNRMQQISHNYKARKR